VKQQVHTSDLLTRLINEAPKDTVDLDWLLGHLQKRAFGLLLLILAIAILVPGLGIVASVAMAFPAVEMMLGRDRPTLPRSLTKRLRLDEMALLRSRNDATLKHLRQNGDSSEAINFEPRGAADYFPGGPFTRQPPCPHSPARGKSSLKRCATARTE
jgi:hypothetical protein